MQKRNALRSITIVVVLILLFTNLSNIAIAENEETTRIVSEEETPLVSSNEESGESGAITPRDITIGTPTWCTLKTSATVYYAPYGVGCESTGYTLAAGNGVYVVSRDYDYFYVYWYINNKEMYGYIAMSALNIPSNYTWTEYDVYHPAICTETTTVLSYAGTSNSYCVTGEIWENESPLMVLGKLVNPYNNITYYYIQYQVSNTGYVKRGWVDSSLGTVTIDVNYSNLNIYESGPYCFVNNATGKTMTWDTSTNNLVQRTKDGSLEQFFFFEKVGANVSVPGYGFVRIISAADPTKALTVQGTGYAEGLRIIMTDKTPYNKRQEFLVDISYLSNTVIRFKILTRSTCEYRGVEVYGGFSDENTKIIQSQYLHGTNQQWDILRVTPHWDETFGQYSGSASPVNRKVHYDSSLSNYVSLSTIQNCVNRWNNAYNLSLQVISGGSSTANNCLATIVSGTIPNGETGVAYCSPVICTSTGSPQYYSVNESSNYVHQKWFSTRIVLDFDRLANYSSEELNAVICHELGHSLKMSHTYMNLKRSNNNYIWKVVATPVSIMSQGPNTKGTYTPAGIEIDEYRIAQKWNTI